MCGRVGKCGGVRGVVTCVCGMVYVVYGGCVEGVYGVVYIRCRWSVCERGVVCMGWGVCGVCMVVYGEVCRVVCGEFRTVCVCGAVCGVVYVCVSLCGMVVWGLLGGAWGVECGLVCVRGECVWSGVVCVCVGGMWGVGCMSLSTKPTGGGLFRLN